MKSKNVKSSKSLLDHSDSSSTHWGMFLLSQRMSDLRTFSEAGSVAALYDAIQIIVDGGLPTPDWVTETSREVVHDYLEKYPTTKLDDASNTKKYRRMYRRWQAVRYLREEKGMTGEGVFSAAGDLLAGTFAGNVAEKTIKNDFYEVENDLKDPSKALRYYRPSPKTAKLLMAKK